VSNNPSIPSFAEALKFWIKLGFISFGGPAGQIAIMHEYLVEKKKWISESKFLHALNYCMLLPGPEAQQLATYTGWLLHGTKGGIAAGVLFILPSVFILLLLSILYVTYGTIPWVYSMFEGLKPAVIAIVIMALLKIGSKSLKSTLHYVIASAAFICIYFFHISFPLIIIGAILFSFLARKFLPEKFSVQKTETIETNEKDYYINKLSVIKGIGYKPKSFWFKIFIGILLWSMPMTLFYIFSVQFEFWKTISMFFTQAAFVTFGGAYAVLPYVAEVSVDKYQWLTSTQMIDGLALGETTPGPLIMVLAFVGFMSGFHHFGSSLLFGGIALLVTTFYTFLPSFIFIFVGAPIIERTQHNQKLKSALELVTAAVVGVVLNLTIYLGKSVILPFGNLSGGISYVSLLWILISLVAMYKYKVGMISWIFISAAFGLGAYLFKIFL